MATPAPPDRERIVVVPLTPVGPRVMTASSLAGQRFAVTIVGGAGIDGVDRAALLPWKTWGPLVTFKAAVVDPAGVPIAGVTATAAYLDVPRSPLKLDSEAKVQAWFDRAGIDLHVEPKLALEGAREPEPSLAQQLANLATMPGNGAHQLRIVRYVEVAIAGTIPAGARLVVAPILTDATPQDAGTIYKESDRLVWPYNPPTTVAMVEAVAIAQPPAPSGELGPVISTLWVRSKLLAATPEEDLVERCGVATRLFERVQELLRDEEVQRQTNDEYRLRTLLSALIRFAGESVQATHRVQVLTGAAGAPIQVPAGATWPHVIGRRVGVTAQQLTWKHLQALEPPIADDVLIWWAEQVALAGALEGVLRDGEVGDQRGPAAEHRYHATKLAARLSKLGRDRWVDETVTYLRNLWDFTLPSGIDALWTKLLRAHASRLWRTDVAPRDEDKRPRGITIQLDDQVLGDLDDLGAWNQLAGVGVLMRRKPAAQQDWNAWRLLNAAEIVRTEDGGALYADEGGAPALAVVPIRLPRRNGIFHPFVTYDHRSLVARSPLDDANREKVKLERGPTAVTPRIFYRQPRAAGEPPKVAPAVQLPPLRFGDTYQVAVFAIDHGFGMPAALASSSSPWKHRPIARGAGAAFEFTPDDDTQLSNEYVYRRNVPVSALRVERTPSTEGIVEGVRPLALELGIVLTSTPPLVVCLPDQQLPSLSIGVPTVDIDVLERSIGIAAARPARQLVLDQPSLVDKDRLRKDAQAPAFVDPAVTGVKVTLEEWSFKRDDWDPAKPSDVLEAQPGSAPWWHSADHRGREIAVELKFGAASAVKADAASGRIAISMARGPTVAVFRVTVTAVVDARNFEAAPGAVEYQLLIERASRELPKDAQLRAWLRATPLETQRAVEVTLRLDGDAPPEADATAFRETMRTVSHGEVVRHAWRWMGEPRPLWQQRSTSEADSERWPPTAKEATDEHWEATAFVDLDRDTPNVPHDSRRLPVPRIDPLRKGHRIALLTDVWDDARSQYLRYGVRLYSRYAPMLGEGGGMIESIAEVPGARNKRRPWWKSVFLPAQVPEVVPERPILGAVLPLTHALDEESATPGFHRPTRVLVVVMQPAYALYGISEGMVAELRMVKDHDAYDHHTLRREYGRDPLVHKDKWEEEPLELRLLGPEGFTLEPDAVEPRFVASAYLLDTQSKHSMAWDFLRVRFRRLIADGKEPRPVLDGSAEHDRTWTEPMWLQLGSDARSLIPRSASIDPASGALTVEVADHGEDPMERVALYAVITRGIATTSATGGERYVATALLTPPHDIAASVPWEVSIDPARLPGGQALYVRVVEAQRATALAAEPRDGVPPKYFAHMRGEALWDDLFPLDPPRDVEGGGALRPEPRLRIIRVSPRATLAKKD